MAYIKEYWQNKEQRAETARKHTKEMQNKYGRCIQTAISATKIYDTDSFNRDFEEDVEDKNTKIIVENIDSVGAVMKYGNPSAAVLNFSSYKNPGGMFLNGSKAQEECLCRSSNLYQCLKDEKVFEDYYFYHAKIGGNWFTDRMIYSSGITVFKDDSPVPVLMPENEWFQVDVITCAAPYLGGSTIIN